MTSHCVILVGGVNYFFCDGNVFLMGIMYFPSILKNMQKKTAESVVSRANSKPSSVTKQQLNNLEQGVLPFGFSSYLRRWGLVSCEL